MISGRIEREGLAIWLPEGNYQATLATDDIKSDLIQTDKAGIIAHKDRLMYLEDAEGRIYYVD